MSNYVKPGTRRSKMPNSNLPIVLRILDNENRLVERADQKSISLLSILGVFMVFFIVYYRVIPINIFTGIMIILYFFFALCSIVSLIMAIRPRIRRDTAATDDAEKALTCDPAFFTGICTFPNAAAYKEALNTLLQEDAQVAEVYIRQIFSVARINAEKYKHVQRGIVLVISSLAIELIIIAYLFLYYMDAGKLPPIM
jgi:ABC-type multidrug transport system permease subunit